MPRVTCTALATEQGPHLELFQKAGFEVTFPPAGMSVFKEENLIDVLRDSDACVAGSEPYSRRVFEALPKLRVIARRGVGFDAIDLQAADDHDVVVTTTPGVLHHSVAEHALAMLLAVARDFPRRDMRVRAGQWKREATPRIMGRTVGIIGLGQIGQAFATRCIGLGMEILAYDPFPNPAFAAQWKVHYVELDELLARSDYVSLHLPGGGDRDKMFNRAAFAKMKPGAIFINTARGQHVDEEALCEALQSGRLAGAGLDVFQKEPLPLDSPILKFDNVLLSGHLAGLDMECDHDIAVVFAETIIGLSHGQWPPQERVRNMANKTDWTWKRK